MLHKHIKDWSSKINWQRLMMSSKFDCILGQLYGTEEIGYTKITGRSLPVILVWLYRHGFDIEEIDNYAELEAEWIRQFAGR